MANLYEFKEEDAYRFAKEQEGKSTRRGNELIFQWCPYCKGNKKDSSTFSINLKTGKFQCKRSSCDAHGNMLVLARDFNFSLSDEVDRYFNQNTYANRFKRFTNKPIEVRDPAIRYLKSRGISQEVTKKYEITTKEDAENILCFPFRDEEGEITFIKYRNIEYKKGDKGNKEWCEKDCKPILFGMNLVDMTSKELVITEGQIDSLSVVEAGFRNAVSVPTGMNGFTWLPHCWDFLQKFDRIIVFGDCEKNKITLLEYLSTRLGDKVKGVSPSDYLGCKDANEILQQYGSDAILKAIDNARKQTSNRLIDMSTIKNVDMSSVPTLHTEIPEIDTMLDGGIKAGQLVIQSGERGNGKSTWGSQVVLEALKQEYNSFMYSGELPGFYVKNWLDRQLIGKQFPTQSEIDKAEKWYRDRLFLFDNDSIGEEESELEVLIKAIEEAIIVKNCMFLSIDNLMTVVDADSNEALYRQQSRFVNRLKKIAQKYSVMIMLIAHPRKQGAGVTDFKNDSVSGSADVTNLADIVMSYDRVYDSKGEEINQNQRKMSITKNRIGGKLTSKSNEIYLFFDEKSKRIADKYKKFGKSYFTDENGFTEMTPEIEEQMNIPF